MSNNLNDVLPASVPKLDVSGGNWAIFALRFQTVVQGKGLWGHFDGSVPCPVLTPSATATTATATTTTATPATATQAATVSVTQEDVDNWNRHENIARSLLAQRLPDSTLVVVSSHVSVKSMWDAIVRDYTYKSTFSQACLRREFTTARCPDKGNVRAFLNDLRAKKAELSAVGVNIGDNDY